MNRKPGYGAQLRANLEPTKGVCRLRQQDGGHGGQNPLRTLMRELRKGIRLKFQNRDVAVYGNIRETGDSEVGSSCWKSTARCMVSGAFLEALENPEDRVPLTPGRTHNHIRSPSTLGLDHTTIKTKGKMLTLCRIMKTHVQISTRTVHGKGQRADMCGQGGDICTDRQSMDSLWLFKISQGKDQHADMCTDGQPRTKPTWAKISRTVHGKGQRAESKDQRADMYSPRGPKSPEQSTGRASVLICV
ncbi:unnamed protein product, partial [Brassica rapa]